jgi:8-hydroxy-5-deazaflavin:NADPH oxidoreductase
MEIGIIGAGRIGQAVARRLVAAGHEVMLSNSAGPESLEAVAEALGGKAHAGTVQEAAAYGEVVFVAIPVAALYDLPAAQLDGKIVVDATNYYPQRDGQIPELDDGSIGSSELLARDLPGSRVVKAMNTMSYVRIAREEIVRGLIDDMGFDPVDAGTLADGRNQQPGTAVYDRPLETEGVRAALAHP